MVGKIPMTLPQRVDSSVHYKPTVNRGWTLDFLRDPELCMYTLKKFEWASSKAEPHCWKIRTAGGIYIYCSRAGTTRHHTHPFTLRLLTTNVADTWTSKSLFDLWLTTEVGMESEASYRDAESTGVIIIRSMEKKELAAIHGLSQRTC